MAQNDFSCPMECLGVKTSGMHEWANSAKNGARKLEFGSFGGGEDDEHHGVAVV